MHHTLYTIHYKPHFLFLFCFHLTYSRWTSSLLPSCLWSQRIFPSLPGSRLTIFLSRCKFSTLTTRQPMVEFYLLTFPRFPSRKKEHKSYFGKNRTHDFRTSRCVAYLLDHSGGERQLIPGNTRGCQSGTWSQRGTKVNNGSHYAHNPLLKLAGIEIATKSFPGPTAARTSGTYPRQDSIVFGYGLQLASMSGVLPVYF